MNENMNAAWDYYIVTIAYCMEVHRLSIIFESKGSELVLEYAGFGAVSADVY